MATETVQWSIIPNITSWSLFPGGGLIHGTSFPFQKLVPKRLGAYTRHGGAYYRNFTVTSGH